PFLPAYFAQRENTSTALCRLRTRFHKTGDAIFLSHLDLSRLMERALRRAELPIAYSQGFNPHPRMVFGAALAVGTESEAEYADFFLRRDISPGEFQKRLNEALPEGVAVSEVRWVDLAAPALTAEVRVADYRVLLLGEISGEERDA
ncbi:MAG: TIGR03936 family radical SAM-associated protein, partial [Firmicutes bacterium]|nr:TIGR03936 family radical SAM-associated protein [Bacillota bacterium]